MSQILLVKLKETPWSYGQALKACRHCRLDPSTSQHGAVVDDQGILHYFHINTSSKQTTELLAFQLHFRASQERPLEPISKPWSFEFVPGLPGELLLVQPCSTRILYASLPRRDSEASDVFLFGSHTATVNCIANNGNIALSGCQAGVLKLWRMADGQLADSVPLYEGSTAAVTAITCIGPLAVAAGNAAGSITLYDIASGRLLAVQRLEAGQGPVSCLSSWIHSEVHAAAAVAPMGPRVPDGGGVLPGLDAKMAWLQSQQQEGEAGAEPQPAAALIAVSSSTGWLRIYAASPLNAQSWQLLHSSHDLIANPITALAFTPCGRSLVVASPAEQILGMEAIAVAVAGGQPGAVSAYSISSKAGIQQELQLWQQWCLKSVPVGLIVLPSSQVQFTTGKRFEPAQALHLLVTPELGPSLVLTTSQPLEALQKPKPQTVLKTGAANVVQQQQGMLGGISTAKDTPHQQQQQQLPLNATELATDFHRLDIAERELTAVADARAGASSLEESDLMAMLEKLVADTGDLMREAGADVEPEQLLQEHSAADIPQHVQSSQKQAQQQQEQDEQQVPGMTQSSKAKKQLFSDSSASAAVTRHQDPLFRASLQASSLFEQGPVIVDKGPSALEQGPVAADLEGDHSGLHQAGGSQQTGSASNHADVDLLAAVAGAGVTYSASAGLSDILLAAAAAAGGQDAGDDLQAPGPNQAVRAAAAACSSTTAAAGEEVESDAMFKRPSTLPTLRSWMNRAAALAAGTAADGPTATIDIKAIAEEMRQQHELLKQQQQQQQSVSSPAAGASAEQPDELQQRQSEAEDELPCESTFQDVSMQENQPPEMQQPCSAADRAQPQGPASGQPEQGPEADIGDSSTHDALNPQTAAADVTQAAATSLSRTSSKTDLHIGCHSTGDTEIAAESVTNQLEEVEPQPRRLPALLQRPQSTGPRNPQAEPWKQQQQQLPQQWRQPGVVGTGVPAPYPSAEACKRPTAAVASAAVQVTSAGEQPATDVAGSSRLQPAQEDAKDSRQPLLQQKQKQQETNQQQPKAPSNVRQRLNVRLRQQQQRQQQGRQVAGSVVTGATVEDVVLPVNDHALATAVANSSRLLAKKIQEGEKAPEVTVDPADVMKLAVQLTDLDVDFEAQQYQDLPDLKDIPTPTKAPKLVPKQLDPRWVASRNLKPQMETLFRPSDWQSGCVTPHVLVLPQWPTPQQVVQTLLYPSST